MSWHANFHIYIYWGPKYTNHLGYHDRKMCLPYTYNTVFQNKYVAQKVIIQVAFLKSHIFGDSAANCWYTYAWSPAESEWKFYIKITVSSITFSSWRSALNSLSENKVTQFLKSCICLNINRKASHQILVDFLETHK